MQPGGEAYPAGADPKTVAGKETPAERSREWLFIRKLISARFVTADPNLVKSFLYSLILRSYP